MLIENKADTKNSMHPSHSKYFYSYRKQSSICQTTKTHAGLRTKLTHSPDCHVSHTL